MKLVFLHGTPGVGKLTVGRELAGLTGYPLFHNHLTVDLVHAVFEFGSAPFVELRERIWLDVMGRAADERLPGLIFTFVFEPTVEPGFFERLQARVASSGGRIYPFELRCARDELLRRVAQPDRAAFGKLRDPEVLQRYLEQWRYEALAPPGNIAFDTTRLSPLETARLIDARLKPAASP